MNQSRFNFPLLILVLALVVMAVCPLTMYSTAPQLAQIAVDHSQRPPSPAELIMISRATAPVNPSQGMGAAGWLAIGLVVIAAAVALFKYGGEALRQWRLVKGKSRSGFHPVPRVPVLPSGFDFEGVNHESN